MASLGSKLIRNALARDVPKELMTAGGGLVAGSMALEDEEINPVTAIMAGLAGGAVGRGVGALGQRAVRKSSLVGNPRMREPDVVKLDANKGSKIKATTYTFPAGKKDAATVRIAGDPRNTVSVNMDLRKGVWGEKDKFSVAETKKLFADTFAAVDDFSVKTGASAFTFIGDSSRKTAFYKSALKKGFVPEGYKAKIDTDGGLYLVRKGKEKETKREARRELEDTYMRDQPNFDLMDL